MANVIIFTDNPPRNLGISGVSYHLQYQSRTAGAYAIASHLRRNGFETLVIDHCASYTLAGIKKIISDNSDGLLWVGISTTFFVTTIPEDSQYRTIWRTSSQLYFDDVVPALIGKNGLIHKGDFVKSRKELIWGSDEINHIAQHCQTLDVPLFVGGAWVNEIRDGNLTNLSSNVHIVPGNAENFTLEVTTLLASDKSSSLPLLVSNKDYDDNDFKNNSYQWSESDLISPDDWLPIEISRGCAFDCSYCSYGRRSRLDSYRSTASLKAELIRNYEKFGVTKYALMDDLYNDSKAKVRKLYEEVWSQLPFKPEWVSYMRLDMFYGDPESAEIILKSGARMGSFGIETFHSEAGKKVGKGLGRDRSLKTLEHLKSVWGQDIIIHGYFIAGLPDEPEDSIIDTINWCATTELLDTVSFSPLWVTPPDHQKFVISLNEISRENDKFNIRWLNDREWINKAGVTFTRAAELAKLGNTARPLYIGSFGDYPEYRQMGWSHYDLVSLKDDSDKFINKLSSTSSVTKYHILNKIKATLGI